MGEQTSKLVETIKQFEGKDLAIPIRGAPDPDSISSALALQHIFKQHNVESQIIYTQEISHEQNLALIKLLNIEMKNFKDVESFEKFSGYCLVDSQTIDAYVIDALNGKPPVITIDHHDKEPIKQEAIYSHVQTNVGATATMLTAYMNDLNILEDNEHIEKISTALMHGIITDTKNMSKAQQADWEMIGLLARHADHDLLKKISTQKISSETVNLMVNAYQKGLTSKGYHLSNAGILRKQDRDYITKVADFMVGIENIHTSIVYAIIDNQIQASIRTTNDKIRPKKLIEDFFPLVKEQNNYGGKAEEGGFVLNLDKMIQELLTGSSTEKQKTEDLIYAFMQKRFYTLAGKEEAQQEKPQTT